MKRILFLAVTMSIVIAMIGIIVVGVTGHNAASRSANEASAIKTLITIVEQQKSYYKAIYPNSFGTFDEMLAANLLDSRFAGNTPKVNGYAYSISVISKSTVRSAGFILHADPSGTEGIFSTGKNHFYLDSDSNAIHVNSRQPATATDPPIGQ